MVEQKEINKIKETVVEFFEKMTMPVSDAEVKVSAIEQDTKREVNLIEENKDVIDIDVKLDEPQILIGQGGQTLFEIQRLLKMILNKKLENISFFNLDINDYKKKKTEYLKDLAKDLANQVSQTKEEKALLPMSAYERRIIHAELAERTDITTESQGDGFDRHIVIKAK